MNLIKKKIFLLLFSLSTFSFLSCENENTEVKKDPNLSDIKIDLSNMKVSNIIFEYKTNDELKSKTEDLIFSLVEESKEELKSDKKISYIFYEIKFEKGKAFFTEVASLNKESNSINEIYIQNNEAYKAGPLTIASCPSGYTELASCSNFSNTSNCVSAAMQTFLSTNVTGVGDSAYVYVAVGYTSTKVCGK